MTNTKELFERIASALEGGELPTIDDSVALELLSIRYWEKEAELRDLSLVSRAVNRTTDTKKMNKDDIQSIVNHLVQQQLPNNATAFARQLRYYIDGCITVSDLLGERERKPRNGHDWQYYDQLGELAERIHSRFINPKTGKPILQTGNRSISNGLNVNLYNLLSELSDPSTNLAQLKKDYGLTGELSLIDTGFLSPSQWRDCHQEFKKYF